MCIRCVVQSQFACYHFGRRPPLSTDGPRKLRSDRRPASQPINQGNAHVPVVLGSILPSSSNPRFGCMPSLHRDPTSMPRCVKASIGHTSSNNNNNNCNKTNEPFRSSIVGLALPTPRPGPVAHGSERIRLSTKLRHALIANGSSIAP